jgi:cytochrome P450
MKRILLSLSAFALITSCAMWSSGRYPSSMVKIEKEYKGKKFFYEYENPRKKLTAINLLGKHKLVTFALWVRNNPIPLFDELRTNSPFFEVEEFPEMRKHLSSKHRPTRLKKLDHIDELMSTGNRNKGFEAMPMVVASLDEDVREILDNPKIFSVRLYRKKMDASVGKFMLSRDGTKINKEKKWMRDMLSPKDLPKVKEMIARLTKQAIKEGNVNGRLDVVNAVARKVPLQLTGEYFGFPGPDLRTLYRWSRDTQYSFFHNAINKEPYEKQAIQSGQEMQKWLKKYLVKMRSSGKYKTKKFKDTILARLIKKHNVSDEDLLRMWDGRIVTNVIGTLVGGVETTQAAIVQVMEFFFENPELMEKIQDAARDNDDELVSRYVWEALRFRPVNPFVIRYAEKDYTLGKGTSREYSVKKDQIVLVATHSAMFDESKVKEPYSFRLDRDGPNVPGSPYFHFGYGHHKCLGDYIAEIEVSEIVKQLVLLPGVRGVNSSMGKIGHHDNIGALRKLEDKKSSPFPESFLIEFDRPTEKGTLTIADPRFAFEDYLMDYDRRFFRACLSKERWVNLWKNIRKSRQITDAQDLFLCRLPVAFHDCMGRNKKRKFNGYIKNYPSCKKHLNKMEKFFYATEVLGAPLDLSNLPKVGSKVVNSGFEFEEDLKFYDRANYRQTFINPATEFAMPRKEDKSTKKIIFYPRIDLKLRKCLAKKVIREKKGRYEAYQLCSYDPQLKLDDRTDMYFKDIWLEEGENKFK